MAETVDILIGDLRLGDAASQHTFDLARALLAADYRVRILVNHRPGPLPDDLRPIIQQTHPADFTPQADLTIVEYPIWYPLADTLDQAPGASLFWYHGVTDPALWPSHATDLLKTSIARTSLAWHATLAVATSPYTAAELQRHAGLPPARLRVVPLGLDAATFAQPSAAELQQLRRKLGLDGRRVLLYVGRCVEHKRLDLLISTLAALLPDHPDLALLLVGDAAGTVEISEYVAQLRRQAAELGVSDRVIFTDRVPSVAPYFGLADLYLQASAHEGFGVPLIEAMAAGVPVIAGASGAMPWVLNADASAQSSSAPAGLLFAPGDGSALTAAVARLLAAPESAHDLAEQGRRRAADFSTANFEERALAVVREALQLATVAESTALDATASVDPLLVDADIALRAYRVQSAAPLVSPLIEWVRINSTTHLKEAYFDRMVEQQVNYNRQLAREIMELRTRVRQMSAAVKQLESAANQASASREEG